MRMLTKNLKSVPVQFLLLGLVIGFFAGLFLTLTMNDADFSFLTYAPTGEHEIEIGKDHSDLNHNISIDASLANELYEKVKILCWIMTGPKNHDSKAKHVKATWGKRCNRLIFMSTKKDPSLPSVALPVKENRGNLWGKTKEAFKYIYKHYYDQYDWFYKADDDTYAVMENMRYMLSFHNNTDPVYFGFRFKVYVAQGYMSGGPGYVLSKTAVKKLVEGVISNKTKCKKGDTGSEDAEIGKCLEAVGVKAGDSRDNNGRSTFLPLNPKSFILPGGLPKNVWIWGYTYYPIKTGMECCSDSVISMHYVDPEEMYLFDYFIYHVRPFGISYNSTFEQGAFGEEFNKTSFRADTALGASKNKSFSVPKRELQANTSTT